MRDHAREHAPNPGRRQAHPREQKSQSRVADHSSRLVDSPCPSYPVHLRLSTDEVEQRIEFFDHSLKRPLSPESIHFNLSCKPCFFLHKRLGLTKEFRKKRAIYRSGNRLECPDATKLLEPRCLAGRAAIKNHQSSKTSWFLWCVIVEIQLVFISMTEVLRHPLAVEIEVIDCILPEFQLSWSGMQQRYIIVRTQYRHVIRNDRPAKASMQAGSQRRLAGARIACKRPDTAVSLHCADVKRHPSSLMKECTECTAEQIDADVRNG